MKTNAIAKRIATKAITSICLFGIATASMAPVASAQGVEEKGTCAFSLQVRKSVAARKQFLVRLDRALNGARQSDVERMYGNIKPASYQADGTTNSFSAENAARTSGIDAFSADCLSCHDGAGAGEVGLKVRNNPFKRMSHVSSKRNDHAIGMDYSTYVGTGHGFKSIAATSNMLFIDGKVGCLTCHNPLNPDKGHLVKYDTRVDLCFSCHDK